MATIIPTSYPIEARIPWKKIMDDTGVDIRWEEKRSGLQCIRIRGNTSQTNKALSEIQFGINKYNSWKQRVNKRKEDNRKKFTKPKVRQTNNEIKTPSFGGRYSVLNDNPDNIDKKNKVIDDFPELTTNNNVTPSKNKNFIMDSKISKPKIIEDKVETDIEDNTLGGLPILSRTKRLKPKNNKNIFWDVEDREKYMDAIFRP